jgi:hypothetical protein
MSGVYCQTSGARLARLLNGDHEGLVKHPIHQGWVRAVRVERSIAVRTCWPLLNNGLRIRARETAALISTPIATLAGSALARLGPGRRCAGTLGLRVLRLVAVANKRSLDDFSSNLSGPSLDRLDLASYS